MTNNPSRSVQWTAKDNERESRQSLEVARGVGSFGLRFDRRSTGQRFFFLNPYISYLRKLTVTTVGQSVGESFAAQR